MASVVGSFRHDAGYLVLSVRDGAGRIEHGTGQMTIKRHQRPAVVHHPDSPPKIKSIPDEPERRKCGGCNGSLQDPWERLRFRPRLNLWLCTGCRELEKK